MQQIRRRLPLQRFLDILQVMFQLAQHSIVMLHILQANIL